MLWNLSQGHILALDKFNILLPASVTDFLSIRSVAQLINLFCLYINEDNGSFMYRCDIERGLL